jgi:hypothetical protein
MFSSFEDSQASGAGWWWGEATKKERKTRIAKLIAVAC